MVCGIHREAILGPILFSLLMNYIKHKLSHCKTILYADDTVTNYVGQKF